MSDKIIIKVISKTYFAIVSFFSFIILFLILIFLVLQNGLYLDNLHISNLYLKNTYIKFDNKLRIAVDDIKIVQEPKSSTKFNFTTLNNTLKTISKITPFIGSVSIDKITMDSINAKFDYSDTDQGTLHFKFKNDIQATALISIDNKNFIIKLKELTSKKYKTEFNGTIILDTNSMQQYSKINILINHDANLTFYSISNESNLSYKIYAHNDIHKVKAILNLIPLNKQIQYWANDAISAKSLQIKNFRGKIDFNDIENAYKQIDINAVAHSLKYKYNKKLAPITTEKTLLEFNNGILYIRPINAYTYKTYLKNSWLKINFTKPHEYLDLYLKLDGVVNDDILNLLATYKIHLPFKQNSGLVNTDLHLGIDLRTIDTNVNGDFSLTKANIDYIGLNLNLSNAHIHLHNSDITIDRMRAKYKNIIDTNITAKYNVKKELGNINFHVNKIDYKGVTLDSSSQKLIILYHLSAEKNILQISRSNWLYKNQKIQLDKLSMPYNITDKIIKIPPVLLSMNHFAKSYISGELDIQKNIFNFDLDLFNFHYAGINLKQTDAHFRIKYNKKLFINAANDLYIALNGSRYKIKKLNLIIDDKSINVKRTSVEIGQYITTKIYAKHLLGSNKINIGLNDFILKTPKRQQVLYNNKKIRLQAFFNDNNISIRSSQLNAKFYSDKDIWHLKLFSLDRIAKNSTILKQLKISSGDVDLFKRSEHSYTQFKANIIYPYALLMNKNIPIHDYKIEGKINKNRKIYLSVNKNIQVKITDKININPKNCGINIHEVIKLIQSIQNIQTKKKSSSQTPKIYLNATNTYIYLGKDRYAISDKIYMQYINNIVTAQLLYKKGQAGFKLENGRFYLYGKNFNDKFMEQFSAFSKFKGGSLDFSLQGSFDNYSGVFFMHKTTIVDYKLLNNVLAFVNTVPSLVTFSLPDYNKDGLYVKNGYLQFTSKNNIFNISDFYIQSKELKILGKGIADVAHDKIKLILNLKTDLASDVSKIPLVGYIIFDGKSLSTTLKVTGKLSDPKVETQIAKDIVVAPLNIIKRTLTLPYKLIKKAVDDVNQTGY